ncbi:neurturin isoform X2 [Hypomesus transpacificus]|nr:neurturin isoform X2 [Hypomesus transpacificus]
MKVWKCAAIALTLCGAGLAFFITDIMVPTAPSHQPAWASSSSSHASSSSSSSSSSPLGASRQRRARSTDGMSSILTELMHLFQTFTEGELRQVVGSLVDRKTRRQARHDDRLGKRTKRAKKGVKPCSLRVVNIMVSELGLGFESDETISFQFCSGTCKANRRNYDLILKKWKRKGISRRDRSPCCRPTAYETDYVLDNDNRYVKLGNYSALDCGCV